MDTGNKIKTLRQKQGLTQEELAQAANTTKQTIHKYEAGIIKNIPADKIKAIADKLSTTPDYLMGWDSELTAITDYLRKKTELFEPLPDNVIFNFDTITAEKKENITILFQNLLDLIFTFNFPTMLNGEIVRGTPFESGYIEAEKKLKEAKNLFAEANTYSQKSLDLRKRAIVLLNEAFTYFDMVSEIRENAISLAEEQQKAAAKLKEALEEFRIKDDPEKNNP